MPLFKKIDRYVLSHFMNVFLATFFGSIFVLLMQFMFRYVGDLVGKGVSILVLMEFFFYAALSLIPLALPLSILLGSLMTFGNLGERLELLAMKAAGISLFRIMRPLIVYIACISMLSFYFADNILPKTQVRMWTLLFSIKEKSPELDIPEGSFYNGIPKRNIYVSKKIGNDLLGVSIYDYSKGFNSTSVIIADSASLRMSNNKDYLILRLVNGETFEHLQTSKDKDFSNKKENIPYQRESFREKEILIAFDTNFKEMSSDFLNGQYVSKNTRELQGTIDSINREIDSIKTQYKNRLEAITFFTGRSIKITTEKLDTTVSKRVFCIDSLYNTTTNEEKILLLETAMARANTVRGESMQTKNSIKWKAAEMRKNSIEWHKRFSLSFACLIFLFIGAPLGAIIRKGGMGMPVVTSTVLFIVYYIIDNTGYKMAREGIWEVKYGMWLSASVLLPLGIILTTMAATDSTILSKNKFIKSIKKFFSKENCIFVHLKSKKRKT